MAFSQRARDILTLALLGSFVAACDNGSVMPSSSTGLDSADTELAVSGADGDGGTGGWPPGGGGGGIVTTADAGSTGADPTWTDSAGGTSSGTATGTDGGSESGGNACTPGVRRCEGDQILQCDGTGTAEIEVGRCAVDEFCDPRLAICTPRLCTPNTSVCNGSIATLCNATGDGFVPGGSDCHGLGLLCVDGMCRDTLCRAGEYSCVDGDVHRCTPDGLQTELVADCGPGEYCRDGETRCQPQQCVPNQPYCAGQVASTCNSEGSGPLPGGTDCGRLSPPQSCDDGRCVALACDPSTYFCEGKQLILCDATGSSATAQLVCQLDEVCDAERQSCTKLACVPNTPVCDDEGLATTCNAQGTGALPGGIDCAAMGRFCQNGECSDVSLLWGEDFEDGDLSDWPVRAPEDQIATATELAAANGTKLGLRLLTDAGTTLEHQGAKVQLPRPLKPSVIRFRARAGHIDRLVNTVFLSESGQVVTFVFFHSNGKVFIPYLSASATGAVSYRTDEWFTFEFAFDWPNETLSLYINGDQMLTDHEIPATDSTGIAAISLYNLGPGTSDWDEFEFVP